MTLQQDIDNFVQDVQEAADNVSTEEAVTVFGAAAGIGGFGAQLVASQKLANESRDRVSTIEIITPALASAAASSVIALSLPGELIPEQ